MSSGAELRSGAALRCPSCNNEGTWKPSRSRSFWEKRVLPLIGRRMFRCAVCSSRTALSCDRVAVSTALQEMVDSEIKETPRSSLVSQNEPDFEELILEIRRSEEMMERDEKEPEK